MDWIEAISEILSYLKKQGFAIYIYEGEFRIGLYESLSKFNLTSDNIWAISSAKKLLVLIRTAIKRNCKIALFTVSSFIYDVPLSAICDLLKKAKGNLIIFLIEISNSSFHLSKLIKEILALSRTILLEPSSLSKLIKISRRAINCASQEQGNAITILLGSSLIWRAEECMIEKINHSSIGQEGSPHMECRLRLFDQYGNTGSDTLIITPGSIFADVLDVFLSRNLLDKVTILELTTVLPLPIKVIKDFLLNKRFVIVIEPKHSPFLSIRIRSIVQRLSENGEIVDSPIIITPTNIDDLLDQEIYMAVNEVLSRLDFVSTVFRRMREKNIFLRQCASRNILLLNYILRGLIKHNDIHFLLIGDKEYYEIEGEDLPIYYFEDFADLFIFFMRQKNKRSGIKYLIVARSNKLPKQLHFLSKFTTLLKNWPVLCLIILGAINSDTEKIIRHLEHQGLTLNRILIRSLRGVNPEKIVDMILSVSAKKNIVLLNLAINDYEENKELYSEGNLIKHLSLNTCLRIKCPAISFNVITREYHSDASICLQCGLCEQEHYNID